MVVVDSWPTLARSFFRVSDFSGVMLREDGLRFAGGGGWLWHPSSIRCLPGKLHLCKGYNPAGCVTVAGRRMPPNRNDDGGPRLSVRAAVVVMRSLG